MTNLNLIKSFEYPKYIEIDGVDGVGKTTQIQLLNNFLNQHDISATSVKEVSNYDDFSSSLREILLLWGLDKKIEFFLFLASKNHCFNKNIKTSLGLGSWVLADRGMPSFSTHNHEIVWDLPNHLLDLFLPSYKPDLSIIIDLPILELQERLKLKKNKSRFDLDINNLIKQKELLINLSETNPTWRIIDWSWSKKKVHKRIKTEIFNFFA